MSLKFCKRCDKETERYSRGECKPCGRARQNVWWHEDPERNKAAYEARKALDPDKIRERKRTWNAANACRIGEQVKAKRAADPGRALWLEKKSFCKTRDIPFNLEPREELLKRHLLEGAPCPCCGVAMTLKLGKPGSSHPELDRVVPSLGYVKSNVRWLCRTCNNRKGDMELEDIRRVYEYVLRNTQPEFQNAAERMRHKLANRLR